MRRPLLVAAALVLVATLIGSAPIAAQPADVVQIHTLSNRADLISGGDALVDVTLPDGTDPSGVRVSIGNRNVTDAFAVREDGRFLGLVTDMAVGPSRITATLPDGSGAYLDVRNHPIGGPVIAGPQVQPWICTTEANGLGPATDEQCNAPTVYEYRYMSIVTRQFETYDPDSPPADVATTTTDEGKTVPYIIRVERGTIDRGIYEIAVLFDPTQPWEPWAPQEQWNRKAYWIFGGDCQPHHVQTAASAERDLALSRGFAVATSGLNTLGTDCNDVVSSEAVMMIKERIGDAYGEIRYTMSEGCSGGSMQQYWTAANYPGLLDGIQPSCSYPDIWETMQAAEDCHLMDRVFDSAPQMWNPDDQAEAAGYATASTCRSLWDNPTGELRYARTWFDPDYPGGCDLPAEVVYSAETNPDGVRCTLQDYQVAMWGRRPAEAWTAPETEIGRGFANRPFDNVGVQYGLLALERGEISVEQFVHLNENVGGLDIDWNPQPERSVADPAALQRAYLGGRITNAAELARIPIVDTRATSNYEIHTDVHSYVVRARLTRENRAADNQVILTEQGAAFVPTPMMQVRALVLLDDWLAAIDADTGNDPLEVKVVRNKPAEAADACFVGDSRIEDEAQCRTLYPYYSLPRLTAGAPMADDVLKCQLRPLDRASYGVEFTDEQWQRLEAAFPDGVCDYSKPGVAQQPPRGPWQTYADGPDGRPLGDAPVSVPFGPEGAPALITRHRGPGRIETSVAVSSLGVDTAETVVLARADEYADALAGAPLAVRLEAPLLLTAPDELSPATASEIRRLAADEVVLLGGEAALAPEVADALTAADVDVRRIAGPTRYATAAEIAAEIGATPRVLVARGDAFADALAASGLGAATGTPVLLTRPGALPDETAAVLSADRDVTIVGGTGAVSDAVAGELDAAAGTVSRLAGPTRYATSAAVADAAVAAGITPSTAWVATGRDFPDALVAGAAAGRDVAVLVLVDGTDLARSPETRDWIRDHAGAIETVRIAGGTAAVSAGVVDELATLLDATGT